MYGLVGQHSSWYYCRLNLELMIHRYVSRQWYYYFAFLAFPYLTFLLASYYVDRSQAIVFISLPSYVMLIQYYYFNGDNFQGSIHLPRFKKQQSKVMKDGKPIYFLELRNGPYDGLVLRSMTRLKEIIIPHQEGTKASMDELWDEIEFNISMYDSPETKDVKYYAYSISDKCIMKDVTVENDEVYNVPMMYFDYRGISSSASEIKL